MTSLTVVFVVATALLSGCATEARLQAVPKGEAVHIVMSTEVPADGKLKLRNEALGTGVSKGAGAGAVAGALWGLVCGPFAILCAPLGAVVGGVTGSAAGAVVGVTGALPDKKAEQLQERLSRLEKARSLPSEIQENLTVRANKIWRLGAEQANTKIVLQVQDLLIMSTRDEQIRCAVRVTVTVQSGLGGTVNSSSVKDYEYLSSYASLAVWLDETNDFVDLVLTAASQQIAAQIVADLSVR